MVQPVHQSETRFILNLYGSDEGYSYTLVDAAKGICRESHLLPYSERYILDCVDNGLVPWKIIKKLKELTGVDLMRHHNSVTAEIRDYRHFSSVFPPTPKIKHVLLRPTNLSLLSDLNGIIKKGYHEKALFDSEKETKTIQENGVEDNERSYQLKIPEDDASIEHDDSNLFTEIPDEEERGCSSVQNGEEEDTSHVGYECNENLIINENGSSIEEENDAPVNSFLLNGENQSSLSNQFHSLNHKSNYAELNGCNYPTHEDEPFDNGLSLQDEEISCEGLKFSLKTGVHKESYSNKHFLSVDCGNGQQEFPEDSSETMHVESRVSVGKIEGKQIVGNLEKFDRTASDHSCRKDSDLSCVTDTENPSFNDNVIVDSDKYNNVENVSTKEYPIDPNVCDAKSPLADGEYIREVNFRNSYDSDVQTNNNVINSFRNIDNEDFSHYEIKTDFKGCPQQACETVGSTSPCSTTESEEDGGNRTFSFLRHKDALRYDKKHYKGTRRDCSTSESDSESSGGENTSESNSESDYVNVNTSSSDSDDNSGNSCYRTRSNLINNEHQSSEDGDRSSSDNECFDRRKHRLVDEQEEVYEDDSYVLVSKEPFLSDAESQKSKDTSPATNMTEHSLPEENESEDSDSDFVGYELSDEDQNDYEPFTREGGPSRDEKHPNALLSINKNIFMNDSDDDDDEADTDLLNNNVLIASGEEKEMYSKYTPSRKQDESGHICAEKLLRFIENEQEALMNCMKLIEVVDSSEDEARDGCAGENGENTGTSSAPTSETLEVTENAVEEDVSERDLDEFLDSIEGDHEKVIADDLQLNDEEREMVSEAYKGILDGTHMDVLEEEVKCSIGDAIESSLKRTLYQLEQNMCSDEEDVVEDSDNENENVEFDCEFESKVPYVEDQCAENDPSQDDNTGSVVNSNFCPTLQLPENVIANSAAVDGYDESDDAVAEDFNDNLEEDVDESDFTYEEDETSPGLVHYRVLENRAANELIFHKVVDGDECPEIEINQTEECPENTDNMTVNLEHVKLEVESPVDIDNSNLCFPSQLFENVIVKMETVNQGDSNDGDDDAEKLIDQLGEEIEKEEKLSEGMNLSIDSDSEEVEPEMVVSDEDDNEDCDDSDDNSRKSLEKLLHGVTSDIILEASTNDFLVKGAQMYFVEEINKFVQDAYTKQAKSPEMQFYNDFTQSDLERELHLESEVDKFYEEESDDSLMGDDGLDPRLYIHNGDLDYLNEWEDDIFDKQEMNDFLGFHYSLDEFFEDENDVHFSRLLNIVDDDDEDKNPLEDAYYNYMDDDCFSRKAVLLKLENQLETCIEAERCRGPVIEEDVDDDDENEIEDCSSEYDEEDFGENEQTIESDDSNENELNFDQRLNLERILVNRTSDALCLDPSPFVGIFSNRLQFEKLKWNAPEIKRARRRWSFPETAENHFEKLYKEDPTNEHVKMHLKRKHSSLLRKQKTMEHGWSKPTKGIKRSRTMEPLRELTLSKLLKGDTDVENVPATVEEEDRFYDKPEGFHRFFQFVQDCRTNKMSSSKDEFVSRIDEDMENPTKRQKMLTLEPPHIVDFMDLEPPSNLDVLKKVFKTPEPAVIQSFPIENCVRAIEEYLLETDRRKKPHYTKVTIYQRNYLENYHGEVLMESLFEPMPPTSLGKFPKIPPFTTCEFGLGSSCDVALYIKQFLDIFSEDGKRACKITYHKIGQPFPFVVGTPYYKPIFPEPPIPKEFQFTIGPSTVNPYPTYMDCYSKFPTQGFTQNLTHLYYPGGPGHGQHHYINSALAANQNAQSQSNSNSYGFLGGHIYNTGNNTSSSSTSTSSSISTSQPPVQIVHPQPRHVQQQQQAQQASVSSAAAAAAAATISSGQIYATSANNPVHSQSIQQQAAANVNFSVNVNSSGIVGISPQQVLTRPHIVSVNVQQQQQQQAIATRPTQQQLQQLAQQRNLRMRQQQLQKHQQYIQQHPTALAKLLTTNIQGHIGSGVNKPITVAVPPQPQNPNKNSTTSQSNNSSSNNLTMSIGSPVEHHPIPIPSPIMISSPPTVSPSPNVNVNVNTAPNVNVNLNTISLDGLLSANQSSINYTPTSNIVTSNVSVVGNNRIVSGTSISPATALNILRLNAAGGAGGNVNLINTNSLPRGLTVSNLNSNSVSIMSPPPQRILVNSAGNVVATQNSQELGSCGLEEISVTDLNSFLNSQQIQISQLGVGQQVALSQNHPQLQQQLQLQQSAMTQQHIRTVDSSHNVNLNLNVNLNSGSGESTQQIAKIQGGEWTATTNSGTPFVVFISPMNRSLNENAGQSAGSSSTVNVNLAALQASTSHPQTSQTIVLEAPNASPANKNSHVQTHHQFDAQNLVSSESVGVDTLFNALSDAIGPELGKKLDVIGGVVGHNNTVVVTSTVNVPISSPVIQSRISPQSHIPTYNLINMQTSPSSSHTAKYTSHINPNSQNTNVITLNDLLGTPIVSSSGSGGYSGSGSFVINSNNNSNNNLTTTGALLSPISIPAASPSSTSSLVSSTPRLSALLAGSPSADSMLSSGSGSVGILSANSSHQSSNNANSLLASAIDATSSHSNSSYGNLLDRLAASLSQPQGAASQIRTGVSRLNPIASATPNVVLEHPMLAASLTQQATPQQQLQHNRATAYRQIAPAPPPNLVSHAHAQPQQLINLLGLTGNAAGQARTIRISTSTPVAGKPSPGSSGNVGGR